MLGVDGDELSLCRGGRDEPATDDERLLVRERQSRPASECRHGGAQTRRPGDRVEDDIAVELGEFGRCVGADPKLGAVRTQRRAQRIRSRAGGQRNDRGREVADLLSQQVDPAPGGRERLDREPVPVTGDDVEGLRTDGTCGPEKDDFTHVRQR